MLQVAQVFMHWPWVEDREMDKYSDELERCIHSAMIVGGLLMVVGVRTEN